MNGAQTCTLTIWEGMDSEKAGEKVAQRRREGMHLEGESWEKKRRRKGERR